MLTQHTGPQLRGARRAKLWLLLKNVLMCLVKNIAVYKT